MTAGQPTGGFISAQVVRELDHPQAKRSRAQNPGRHDDERDGCCGHSTQLLNLERIVSQRMNADRHVNQIAGALMAPVPNDTWTAGEGALPAHARWWR